MGRPTSGRVQVIHQDMKFKFGDHERLKKKAKTWAVLTLFFLLACFAVIPAGRYMILILAGITGYSFFLTIYYLVLSSQARYPYRQKKETTQERETREYVRAQLPILISVVLGGLLLVLAVWFFLS
jgi:hypothetical protein